MLLADILARDANSIAVDAYDAGPPDGSGSLDEGQQSAIVNNHRLSIMNIPDNVLLKILEFRSATQHQSNIRLVNKRLATLALQVVFHTISVKTFDGLLRLVFAPLSPLYLERLGKHVRCFEIAFFAQDYQLLGAHYDIPFALPNLETLRFRFTCGIPINTGENVYALLSEDTLRGALHSVSDCSRLRFLSQFKPKNFVWISDEPKNLHLVGLHTELRLLFQSWNSLAFIYLDGICLVEQPDLATWTPAFPAQRTHIRGVSVSSSTFLDGLANIRHSTPCHILLLEAPEPEDGSQIVHREDRIPLVAFGTMLVALKGWNAASRRSFVDMVTKKSKPLLIEPNTQYKYRKQDSKQHSGLPTFFGVHLFMGIFAAVFCCAVVRNWHRPAPHRDPYSRLALYSKADLELNSYRQESLYNYESSLQARLLGLDWPLFGPARQSSKANRIPLTFVPT